MSELSPKELEIIETLRSEWGPTGAKPPSPEAIRARLADKPWLDRPLPSRPAPRFVRLIGATMATVGICTFGFVALREDAKPAASVAIEPPRAPSPVVPTAPSPFTASSAAPSLEPTIAIESLPDAPPVATAVRAARKPEAEAEADSDTLAEELELVRAAQNALREGAPDRALRPLSTHESRFPRGILRDERMTLQALAHCARGDVATARALKSALERISPGSSHLQRLTSSCAR